MSKAQDIDTPNECPECGRRCANTQSFISHYSLNHEKPYPWVDRTVYGRDFEEQREKALERDNHTCRVRGCDEDEQVLVHHMNENKRDHRLVNLLTLCRSHHQRLHFDRPLELEADPRETVMYWKVHQNRQTEASN